MPVWEYRVLNMREQPDSELALNALGADRWELVAVANEAAGPVAYFRRESIHPAVASVGLGDAVPVVATSSEPARAPQVTVRVSARDDPGVIGWVDSGLEIDEECAGISLSIMGEVRGSSGRRLGPEGDSEQLVLNPAIGEELPAGCLLARIGEEGTVEPVYFSGFLAAEETGRLFLAVNDQSYEDNDGEFTVTLTAL